MLGRKRVQCAIMINDSDKEMQDVSLPVPSEGKYRSYTLTVISSDESCPNYIGEVLHGPH